MKKSTLVFSLVTALCCTIFVAPAFSANTTEANTDGCLPGLASCCLAPIPTGQIENSGYDVPSRAWMRLLIIPAVYDSVRAYQGETLEEYGLKKATTAKPKGGLLPGLSSCCLPFVGLPQGQVMNSNKTIPTRSLYRSVPYVGLLVGVYDGITAYEGEDMETYGLDVQ